MCFFLYIFVLTPFRPPQTHLRVLTQAWPSLRSPAGRSLLLRLLLPQRSHRATSCQVCVWKTNCCAVRWPPSIRRWPQSSRERKTYRKVSVYKGENYFGLISSTSLSLNGLHFDFHVDLNQTRLRADKWNSEQSQTDRMLRNLQSQVDDLTEALSAKDGQLAVLKVRLDEADQLLKSRNAALDEAQKEKSRWPLFEEEITFSFSWILFQITDLLWFLESCKTTQRGPACIPKP